MVESLFSRSPLAFILSSEVLGDGDMVMPKS